MRLTYCFAICLMQIIFNANVVEPSTPPKPYEFDTTLETKTAISMKDTDMIHATVKSWNLDGRPFQGESCLSFYITHDYNAGEAIDIYDGCKKMVNGRAEYNLNVTEHGFEKYNNVDKTIQIIVTVTEKEYNYQTYRSTHVKFYSNRYNLDRCVSTYTCSNLNANVEQDVVYQISHVDGSPVSDTTSIVKLTYTDMFDIDESQYDSNQSPSGNPPLIFTGHMNETGFVHFKVTLPVLSDCKGAERSFVKQLQYMGDVSIITRVHVLTGW